jgi:ribosomal protein S18 acetylase RimI-like enzyme
MNEGIRIRRADPEDVASLAALSQQLGYITSKEEIQERLPKLNSMKEHTVFVAFSRGEDVVGWIHVLISHRPVTESFAELGGLIVADGYRGQGIGEALLYQAERWAAGEGLEILRIRARSTREAAHRFYIKMGYQLQKEQKIFEKYLKNRENE